MEKSGLGNDITDAVAKIAEGRIIAIAATQDMYFEKQQAAIFCHLL
jgi:hypothetical protein